LLCTYSKAGQTSGLQGLTLEDKAKWFAYQYLRIIRGESLNFFLCKIQAADWHILTIREWETEMFQQIDLMLTSKNIPQELPEMSQEFAEELERMADNYDDSDPNNDENGGWFTFHPNMNRTEVRVFATA
jgi:hypothetical protein